MLMSISTRSGASPAAAASASSPEAASPTSSKPGIRRSTAAAATRKGRWSSTISTRTVGEAPSGPVMPPVCRDPAAVAKVVSASCPVWPAPLPGRVRRRPAAAYRRTLSGGGAVLVQVEQHGLDPPVEVALLGERELGEDRVGVLLDRALGEEEGGGDRGVALALRHLAEDLELARGEGAERRVLRAAV